MAAGSSPPQATRAGDVVGRLSSLSSEKPSLKHDGATGTSPFRAWFESEHTAGEWDRD